jgi:hypothetical protein
MICEMALNTQCETRLLPIKVGETITKRKKKKLERANNIYGRAQWSVQDFGHKLPLSTCGWDARQDITLEIISQDELEEVFGKS